jgi:hypothetical protein
MIERYYNRSPKTTFYQVQSTYPKNIFGHKKAPGDAAPTAEGPRKNLTGAARRRPHYFLAAARLKKENGGGSRDLAVLGNSRISPLFIKL